MIRRTLTFLLVAGSIGGLAAGCGSSSKTPAPAGTSAAPASTSSAGTTGSGTTGATGATGATGGGGSVNAAAVTACKNTINSHATLSSSLKAKLLKLCNNITPANAKQVGKQICLEIVNTQLPAGTPASIKDKALAACKKA